MKAVHLDDNVITEILLRLPAKSVLRCRAVCKSWRRITADPAFLAAHARRRPLEVLLYTMLPRPGRPCQGRPTYNINLELDALTVSGDHHHQQRRRLLTRFPKNKHADVESFACGGEQYCPLLASCDGLLLVRPDNGSYLVCNPAKRRWSDLPRLDRHGYHRECVFYFHEPSGEYHLLSRSASWREHEAYYVLSAGADEPRQLDVQATAVGRPEQPPVPSRSVNLMTPAILHGHLHWLRHMEAGYTGQMVAFDTVAETFRRMPPPPMAETSSADVLAVDELLMAADFGAVFVDFCVLEGYGAAAKRWERRHRVVVPWQGDMPSVVASGDEGDVVLGTHRGLVVYNVRRKTARVVDVEAEDILLSRRVHRESMVPHAFFDARPHPGLPLFTFS